MTLADLRRQPDQVPRGWKTSAQWAKAWRCSNSHAQHTLTAALNERTVRRRLFRVKTASGVRPVPHYAAK